MALLEQDRLSGADGGLVACPLGNPAKLLVAGDLQVLEGVGESGELRRSVGLGGEERSPVERSELHHGVLEEVRSGATGLQPCLDQGLVILGLAKMLLVV